MSDFKIYEVHSCNQNESESTIDYITAKSESEAKSLWKSDYAQIDYYITAISISNIAPDPNHMH